MAAGHRLVVWILCENRKDRRLLVRGCGTSGPHPTAAPTFNFPHEIVVVPLKRPKQIPKGPLRGRRSSRVGSQAREQSVTRRKIGFEPRFGRLGRPFLRGFHSPKKCLPAPYLGFGPKLSTIWEAIGRHYSPGHRPSKGGHAKITRIGCHLSCVGVWAWCLWCVRDMRNLLVYKMAV